MTTPEEDVPPPEVAAMASDDGPIPTLTTWLLAVREDRRWDRAMELMTPELRLASAQRFVLLDDDGTPGGRAAAEALAGLAAVEHPLFAEFGEIWLEAMDESFAGWPAGIGFGSQPRPVDLDHELLIVVPYSDVTGPTRSLGGGREATQLRGEAADIRQLGFLMRHAPDAPTGWLLAGWRYDQKPEPGWPPRGI
ncbi:hypothetical protein E4P40_20445 [Blastococcus sp. CT_GayMR20]|uniref:hypothetical protein n=1 Tax=Blastococcus sp. CT_GayMR20 TaxID=2559609 RepID=UPI001073DA21|nr:hypothetical protein [Blastococcus sp. CT_GayMR20]TFV72482.1 hypothetical protein E4P40_20445 [Blastococcus sp. CT_GayMR20]